MTLLLSTVADVKVKTARKKWCVVKLKAEIYRTNNSKNVQIYIKYIK